MSFVANLFEEFSDIENLRLIELQPSDDFLVLGVKEFNITDLITSCASTEATTTTRMTLPK